jgi:multiple sugar transport system substrate-binding protein
MRGGGFLDQAAGFAAFDLLHELASHVPADNLRMNPIQVADALSAGDRWVYCPLLFGYSNYSRAGFRENRLRYIDIPASADGVAGSLLGGAGIAVSASSTQREEAVAHAFWLASAEVQAGPYFDGGGQPGNAVAWEDDRLNRETLDFFRGTRATLEGAYLRPRHPRYIEVQDRLSPLVTKALAGGITDREALDRMNQVAVELMETGRDHG